MLIYPKQVLYKDVPPPQAPEYMEPVDLTDRTMAEHKEKLLQRMNRESLDALVIYGDREHGANFGYLAGFEPRFEEAAIVLHKDGDAYMLLGNESLRMAQYSRLPVKPLHVPYFSLPNQPMDGEQPLAEIFKQAKLHEAMRVGVAGWKMFTGALQDNGLLFDVPHFIIDALKSVTNHVSNAAHLFIHPESGARAQVNANEIAHYEFGAALASHCVKDVLDNIRPGKTEMELAQYLSAYGQPITVQTICATGDRFTNAIVAPRAKKVSLGDRFTANMGLRGGLTNRTGYVAESEADLPDTVREYLTAAAKPYFAAAATWYATVDIGVTGSALYDAIETVAPKSQCGWKLNPGHLVASEEWMSSPIEASSQIAFKSGMMLQMDIIFSVSGFGGCNAEDGVALADENLRFSLKEDYPDVWRRISARREYMRQVLGIFLNDSVLPLSSIAGYVRPLLLSSKAFCLQ